jgi:hypothetical protein
MLRERLETAAVIPGGVLGDRSYALIDHETQKVVSDAGLEVEVTSDAFARAGEDTVTSQLPLPGATVRRGTTTLIAYRESA